jgi:hypothetical protein
MQNVAQMLSEPSHGGVGGVSCSSQEFLVDLLHMMLHDALSIAFRPMNVQNNRVHVTSQGPMTSVDESGCLARRGIELVQVVYNGSTVASALAAGLVMTLRANMARPLASQEREMPIIEDSIAVNLERVSVRHGMEIKDISL